jgi:hypothetical protein
VDVVIKRNKFMMIGVFVLSLHVLPGCSIIQSYGRLDPEYKSGDQMTIEALEEFWEDYTVYFTGCCGGLQPLKGHPSAVMFDPKGDDKKLLGERWLKVETKYRLNELITRIKASERFESYYPSLYRILGPDDEFYGYMFTSWRHVVLKSMGDKTLYVFDLEAPPYLEQGVGGPGRSL